MPLGDNYTDSGFFSDYIGTVTDAYFGTTEKRPDDYVIFLEFATDSPDRPEHTENYSLGQGWVSEDGGVTVKNDRGGKKFNKRFSQYAKFIDAAVPLLMQANVPDEFANGFDPSNAEVWKGTRWQIEDHVEKYARWNKELKQQMKDENGQVVMGESHTNLPTAFLGFAGEGGEGKSASSNGKADLTFIPDAMMEKLVGVAKQASTRDAFLDRTMLDVAEVSSVEGLLGKLAGAGVYESLRAS